MNGKILLGVGRELRSTSDDQFVQTIRNLPERMAKRLEFMSPDHHVVRDFVVRELPREVKPLSPLQIAQVTALEVEKVTVILKDLEEHLFFLVRNADGNVSWAFPVTTDRTQHRLTYSTGEHTFGA